MAVAYNPPGVNVEELFSPSVNPLLSTSAQICVVGVAQGFQKGTTQGTFAAAGTNEVQNVAVNGTGGTFTLSYAGQTTAAIAYNATASVVRTSLEALSNINAGNVMVTGGPGDLGGTTPYIVTFQGTLGGTDVAQMTANSASLTGAGHAVIISTETSGGPPSAVLTAPTGSVFQRVNSNKAFDSVRNLLNPVAGQSGLGTYTEGIDFSVSFNTGMTKATVVALIGTDLGINGGVLAFNYRFVPDRYYDPTRLDSQSAVEARYGPAFDGSGVVTPLSACAAIAFENGAQSVVVQPLFKLSNGLPIQPTVDESDDLGQWQSTLQSLRDLEDINILVPAFPPALTNAAQLTIVQAVQDHLRYQQLQGDYLVLVTGFDAVTASDLRNNAAVLRTRGDVCAEQTVVVSPARFTRALPSGSTVVVGGQYAAAAIAGMIAARPVSSPVTRKIVSGFITVNDSRDKVNKNADAAAGLLVIEQKGTGIQVRHGLTVDNTSTARRELSVVRAKHRMITSISETLDTQIIGTVPADGNAPMVVKNAVISVLELLRQRRELVDYTGVQARLLTNDPTTVECRFSYLPAFPLNYVNVVFSLDLSGGAITTEVGTPV